MVAVIEQRDVLWPQILWERIEALHVGLPGTVGQETERVRNLKWIIDLALLHVWLSEDDQRRSGLGYEEGFHGRESNGLILRDHAPLAIAGGEQLQNAKEQSGNHADFHENARVLLKLSPQQIEGAHGRHHKRTGDYGTAHVMRILPPGPGVED